MRTAITLVRRHGAANFEVVAGTDVPVHEQIADAKKLAQTKDRTHPEYAEIQVWVSDIGIAKSIRFKSASADSSSGEPEPKVGRHASEAGPEVELPKTPPETNLPSPTSPEVELPKPAATPAAPKSKEKTQPKKPSGKTA